MKHYLKPTFVLAGALLTASSFLNAGTSVPVATDPVGYVTLDLPAGNSAVSNPLLHSNTFSGVSTAAADGASSATFTFGSNVFTAGDLDSGDLNAGGYINYYLVVTTAGSNEGLVLDVLSNTADSVTVADPVVSAFSLSQAENVVIRKHSTIGDIFSSSTGLSAFVTSLSLFNDDGTQSTFLWTGTDFVDGGFASVADRPVYPGEGFIFFSDAAASVVVSGSVATVDTKIPVFSGAAVNFLGTITPSDKIAGGSADVTLGSLGIGTNLTAFVGAVKFFSTDGNLSSVPSQTYLWDGTVFRDNAFGDASDVVIPSNAAIVVSNDVPVYITIPEAYTSN